MQPADLTLLSSTERPLMPSWEWSAAFKVAWKRKTWQDCSGIEAALRSQVRTASGPHKACGETAITRSSKVSSLPFSPTSRALKSQTSGCSQRWHLAVQAGMPHHCNILQSHQKALFFLVFPYSSSLGSPCKVCLHIPPSSCLGRNSKHLSPESENVMPTLLAVLSQLSLCTFLWGTVLSHTHFLHQTYTDLYS